MDQAPASSAMAPPELPQTKKARRYTKDEWESHKNFIFEMYPRMTSEEMVKSLLERSGFSITVRQLKRKVESWGLDKNVKSLEMKQISRKRQRRQAQGKATDFRVRGYPVIDEKIDRWMKRNPTNHPILPYPGMSSPALTSPTISAISYNTPSEIRPLSPNVRMDGITMLESFLQISTSPRPGLPLSIPSTAIALLDGPIQSSRFYQDLDGLQQFIGAEDSDFVGQSPAPFTVPSSPVALERQTPSAQPMPIMQIRNAQIDPQLGQSMGLGLPSSAPKSRYLEKEEMDLRQRLDAFLNQLSPTHPAALDTLCRLVSVYTNQGRYRTAEVNCKQLVERSRIGYGKDDHRTLRNMSTLAMILRFQGRIKSSVALSREIHISALSNFPPPKVVSYIKCELALGLCQSGDEAAAELLVRESLRAISSVLRPDDEQVLRNMSDLAYVLERTGKCDESVKIMREVLIATKLSLDLDDSYVRITKYNLGRALMKQQKFLEAEAIIRDVYEEDTKYLGNEHPDTLRSRILLAHVLEKECRYDESEAILNDVIPRSSRVLGPQHPQTLIANTELVYVLSGQARFAEAEKLGRETTSLCEQALGFTIPTTFYSFQALGQVFRDQGRFEEALNLLGKALKDAADDFGPNNSFTKACSDNYIAILQERESSGDVATGPDVVRWDAMDCTDKV